MLDSQGRDMYRRFTEGVFRQFSIIKDKRTLGTGLRYVSELLGRIWIAARYEFCNNRTIVLLQRVDSVVVGTKLRLPSRRLGVLRCSHNFNSQNTLPVPPRALLLLLLRPQGALGSAGNFKPLLSCLIQALLKIVKWLMVWKRKSYCL